MPVKWDRTFPEKTLMPALTQAFVRYGQDFAAEIKRSISTPYPPASRAGQPPHRRTSGLRGSIRSVVFSSPREVVLQTGSDLPRSAFLEFGTSRMAARPFLRPAMRKSLPALKKELKRLRLPRVSRGFVSARVSR